MLELSGITKQYPGVLANDDVSIRIGPGEVLGVLGENGAGKSTLMNVLAGLLQPDSGSITLDGKLLSLASPRDAMAAGIGMVHQHFKLVENLTVEENLALAGSRGIINYRKIRAELARLTSDLGIDLDPATRIDELPIGQQQEVEIVKSLWRRPRVLILDEPTAVLAPDERQRLMDLVHRMKTGGTAVILISHKLEDILGCCDRVVVMRQGRVVDSGLVAGRSRADLVRMVVGGALAPVPHREGHARATLLSLENVVVKRANGTAAVNSVSFALRAGEVLGLCGVEGNGQSELMQTVAGMTRPSGGRLSYCFGNRQFEGPLDARSLRRLGLAHVPEDRLRYAVVPSLQLQGNWLLTHLDDLRLNRRGWLRWREVLRDMAQGMVRHDVRVPGLRARIEQLSGGNQQKLVLARELARQPSILLVAHPSRGLDVRTVAYMQRTLLEARDRGAGVLVLSADLAELWEIADRVMVMVEGRLRGPVAVAQTTEEEIGHWMTVR